MRDLITQHINQPQELEKMYRSDASGFKTAFMSIYPDIKDHLVAKVWFERLKASETSIVWGFKNEWIIVLIIAFFAGIVAKLPHILSIDEDFYFFRNISFVVFPFLTTYIAWRSGVYMKGIVISSLAFIISAIYINLLPDQPDSDTLVLVALHLPLFLWTVFGFSYLKDGYKSTENRLEFLRFNGDLAVMMAILAISGAIVVALSFGMFSIIQIDIERIFENYVLFWGLPAIPILGTYLIKTNPRLVHMVSPVIAKVFTPIVLITLIIYLGAVVITGMNPYHDRDFLLIFNLILIGVMAIIFFSILEASKNEGSRWEAGLLLSLSAVAIILNSIALSAILYRLFEFGITPNRLAVMGGNVLILTNLVIVAIRLYLSAFKKQDLRVVGTSISSFLPIYGLWTMIVVFLFPLIFGFR